MQAPGGGGKNGGGDLNDELVVSAAVLTKAWDKCVSRLAPTMNLDAAVLQYLTGEDGRYARTVAAMKEEMLAQGGGNDGNDVLVGSETALEKAWNNRARGCAPDVDLDTAILEYLEAKGGRYAQTVEALESDRTDWNGGRDLLKNVWTLARSDPTHNTRDNEAFFDAIIKSGDLAEVQLCVCVGNDIKRLMGPDNGPPLYWAARTNRLDIVQYFIKSGHNKDWGTPDDTSPLMVASYHGHIEVVRCLVEHGADKEGDTFSGWTALITACVRGQLEVAEYLLEQGCDIEHASNDGMTPLLHAADRNQEAIAQLLYRYGAKLDVRDKRGNTAVDFATRRGCHDFADAFRAEETRRRDHGLKRDPSTIKGTEEHEASKRPRRGASGGKGGGRKR
jgi:hypothetical protein